MAIKSKDEVIFGDKSLSNLLEDIYSNTKKKQNTISSIMSDFLTHNHGGKELSYIGPVVKDLLDVSVKNDEHLIKIATIIQRIITNGGSTEEDALGLTDEMKDQLLSTISDISEDSKEIDKKISSYEE